ncbi:endocuticle structural glycoprotein SgAbd-8-like [Macrosteles quadrilineatus]|uniref:endocuticle structural glycoprotein SgAbd-8-like n=1 Tax=Macrosteles quadrilineatus TaxID=74068 RepID=UPI0023E2E0A7|nr:endocuticle structural glycoprotein SgAbd-8-like [Macrosteles quadrilineatus]
MNASWPEVLGRQEDKNLQDITMVHIQAVVILAVVGTALCLPQRFVPTLSRSYDSDPSGVYRSSFQTGDGALVQESGFLRPTNDRTGVVVGKSGSFAYTSPEGKPVSVSYTADEYGFHPVGDVLPVAPPANPPSQQTF